MPIAATDLIALSPLNRPEDDVVSTGGGIDIDHRPVLVQLAANDTLEMVSDQAADTTQGVTVTGRNAAGAVVSDTKTVNGVTIVAFTGTFERVTKVVMDADATGIITVRRGSVGPTVSTIPVGERGFHIHFQNSASAVGAVTRYEKLFWKNNHGSLTLNEAKVQLSADPAARLQLGIETAKDDTVAITNRLTVPGNPTFVGDGVDQNVPGTTLEAASAIGTWIEQALLAADAPIKNTYTTQLSGTSV